MAIVLVINAGSSSDKCILFDMPSGKTLWNGLLDWSKKPGKVFLQASTPDGLKIEKTLATKDRQKALTTLLETAWTAPLHAIENKTDISRVGHRVVHGGKKFSKPTVITSKTKNAIHSFSSLAPLHNPPELASIEILEKLLPKIPQVAVFDTAFHTTIPEFSSTYPIPYSWTQEGIKRFGFHGISHSYCTKRASELLGKKINQVNLITCHLGNGASLTAVQNGKSVNTSMGFTPLEGLMMGSRSGSIDPGILLYMLQQKKMTPDKLSKSLYDDSGFTGVCGEKDLRNVISKAENGNKKAILALEMYVHILRYHLCAMRASLQKLDAIVFAGGVGENSAYIREKVCNQLDFLGIHLDSQKNKKCVPDQEINSKNSKTKVLVVHTREELAIANEICQI